MKNFIVLLCLLLISPAISAEKIIGDLDFSDGEWALVGIPIHNYKKLPIQEELNTFISKDLRLLQDIQQRWDFDMTFEDKCDYHYALKFYHNRELVRTVTLNLYCGYVTLDGLSYEFDPAEFERFKRHAKDIPWSRISFSEQEILQKAIRALDGADDVYWYEDIHQYRYSGYFMFGLNQLPWNTNLDSLHQAVNARLESIAGQDAFYLQKYYHLVQGDHMLIRYFVNCEPAQARRLESALNAYLPWRPHLVAPEEGAERKVSILAIGVDEKRYWRLMRE